jgi:hypothetical protein
MKSTDERPRRVYRYIPVHRLWQILATRSLYFMRNSKWDDPFEGFLAKQYCSITNKNFFLLNAKKFFLCCCRIEERDHLWRNYTPNKDGVLVTFKTQELLAQQRQMECYPIKYPKRHEIEVLLKKINRGQLHKDQLLSLFFIKRRAFEPESEIRFLIEDSTAKDDIKEVDIEPNMIIERVLFDPRMDYETYKYHRQFIQDQFHILNIVRSSLYDPERSFSTR